MSGIVATSGTTGTASARRQVARRRPPPTPPHPFPNPTYTDGFPMREPGPVALPRAAGEYTEQELQGAFRPLPLPTHPGDWAHFANVGALARTAQRFFMYCGRSLPPFAIRKNTTRTLDLRRHMTAPHEHFPHGFPRLMCPGENASLHAPRRDRVSHGTSFFAPGSLARRRLA